MDHEGLSQPQRECPETYPPSAAFQGLAVQIAERSVGGLLSGFAPPLDKTAKGQHFAKSTWSQAGFSTLIGGIFKRMDIRTG